MLRCSSGVSLLMQLPVSKKAAWAMAPYTAGVSRVSVGMFTVASLLSFALRERCRYKGVAGEKVWGRFIWYPSFWWQLLNYCFCSPSRCAWSLCMCEDAGVFCGKVPRLRISWNYWSSLKWKVVKCWVLFTCVKFSPTEGTLGSREGVAPPLKIMFVFFKQTNKNQPNKPNQKALI